MAAKGLLLEHLFYYSRGIFFFQGITTEMAAVRQGAGQRMSEGRLGFCPPAAARGIIAASAGERGAVCRRAPLFEEPVPHRRVRKMKALYSRQPAATKKAGQESRSPGTRAAGATPWPPRDGAEREKAQAGVGSAAEATVPIAIAPQAAGAAAPAPQEAGRKPKERHEGGDGAGREKAQAALLAAARGGDEAALGQLLADYTGLLAKAAHQRHLAALAEEAAAAARVSFWEAVMSYDADRGVPFPGWAKAKVYGDLWTLFKQARRRWRHEVLPGEEAGEGPAAADEALLAVEADAAFAARLQGLTPRAQDLLRLLYQEDLTLRQAAARLGISQQAASAMKNRALHRLRGNG